MARFLTCSFSALALAGCDACITGALSEEPAVIADSDPCASDTECVVGEACSFGRCGPKPPSIAAGAPFFFGAFGDCLRTSTADSPEPVVEGNFRELADRQAQFVVMVGDYLLVVPASYASATSQLATFQGWRQLFNGPVYYALGNHDAAPENLRAYRERLTREVYYAFTLQVAPLPGSATPATAKFVFVADNAWSPAQATWLEGVLGTQTDYTFVIRHHTSDTAVDSQPTQIIGKHPLTLLIVGHIHVYRRIADREVITGNGGTPVFQGPYGYLTVQQGADGRVTATSFDESTNQPVDSFTVDP